MLLFASEQVILFLFLSVGFPSCQFVLVLMSFFAMACCLMARVNLSVALVAMVKGRTARVLEPIREDTNRSRTADVCFANDVTNDTKACVCLLYLNERNLLELLKVNWYLP